MLYHYLFFQTYSLALKSSANRDSPHIISITYILMCFVLNIFGLNILSEGFGYRLLNLNEYYKFLWVAFFILIVFGYFTYKKRYESIYNRLLEKYGEQKTVTSILVLVIYYLISLVFLFFVSMFKNKDWIFS